MEEIKHYDLAAQKFLSKQTFKSLPLEAWDLFAEQFGRFCKGLEEIKHLKILAKNQGWQDTVFFEKEILQNDHIVVVTDARLNIVHATKNIFQMNGYHPEEIVGKNPKIFQGKGTDRNEVSKIGRAVRSNLPFEAIVVNYRKDGTPYKCWIKGGPVKDRNGKVVNFVAFEREVA